METVSAVLVGLLVLALGALGLRLAVGALDGEMLVFGVSLFLFAVLFIVDLVRRAGARRAEAANARAGGHV